MWTSHQGVEHENTMWGIITVAWLALPLLLHLIMAHFPCDQPKIPHRYHNPMEQFIFFVANFGNTHLKKNENSQKQFKDICTVAGGIKTIILSLFTSLSDFTPLKSPPWFSKSSLFETAVNINCNKPGFQFNFTEIFFTLCFYWFFFNSAPRCCAPLARSWHDLRDSCQPFRHTGMCSCGTL